MAETTDDVRRDIELTRERMSSTFAELEHKLNVMEMVKNNPWPAIALAVGAGGPPPPVGGCSPGFKCTVLQLSPLVTVVLAA